MSQDIEEELDSQDQDVQDTEKTEDVEETDAQSETEDNGPKYTELEMKLHARAKKAEAEAKRLKAEKMALLNAQADAKPKQESNKQDHALSEELVDEKILRSKGYDDDAIEELRYIAGRQKTTLLAAEHDKRFIRFVGEQQEEKRRAEASLGASKGSGRKAKEADFAQPGLDRERHEELFRKKMGL